MCADARLAEVTFGPTRLSSELTSARFPPSTTPEALTNNAYLIGTMSLRSSSLTRSLLRTPTSAIASSSKPTTPASRHYASPPPSLSPSLLSSRVSRTGPISAQKRGFVPYVIDEVSLAPTRSR